MPLLWALQLAVVALLWAVPNLQDTQGKGGQIWGLEAEQGLLSQGTEREQERDGNTACRIAWCCGKEVVGRKESFAHKPTRRRKMVGVWAFGLAHGPGVTV